MWITRDTSPRWKRGALVGALLAGAAAPLAAQITEVNRSPVTDISRVTFGYLCDDTFVLRNDGSAICRPSWASARGPSTPR